MSQHKDCLFELGTEELPPKALLKLSHAFSNNVSNLLKEHNLDFAKIENYAAPRRLAIIIRSLSVKQTDKQVKKKGPAKAQAFDSSGEPSKALQGFAKSCGVAVEQLVLEETPKGDWFFYDALVQGKASSELLPQIFNQALKKLPIPKLMRWGNLQHKFVRPVRWATLLLGDDAITSDFFGVTATNQSQGHRFMSSGPCNIHSANDYTKTLHKNFVIADFNARKQSILDQLQKISQEHNIVIDLDDQLLNEVTSIVEWPNVLLGTFDQQFLSLPHEVLETSMRVHQKCFLVKDQAGNIKNQFAFVANITAENNHLIVDGNERVMRARLADAKFFYESDLKQPLAARQQQLEKILFQKELGSIWQKSERIAALAKVIAENLGIDSKETEQAAYLCKCDLATDMVGEFPELQGVIGSYYAINDGLSLNIQQAIRTHYYPRSASDQLPENRTAIAIAIADKIDTIAGIFSIGQKPTGEKDPYALRRAMLGVLKTIIARQLNLTLDELFSTALSQLKPIVTSLDIENTKSELLSFALERLRALYLEEGVAAGIIKSVLAKNITAPHDFDLRIKAVQNFLTLPEALELAAANKRVTNILNKQEVTQSIPIEVSLFEHEAENNLYQALTTQESAVRTHYQEHQYQPALASLASLNDSVNAFFENVMVNTDNPKVRNNRLSLLCHLRELFSQVADISEIQ